MIHKGKVFNDPIHGHIELSGLSVKIIDTPQFQRLRDVSQLGGAYYIFPGAASRRFEHSLGVSHLSRHFVESLRRKQPELGISDFDILCIEVAGLCHDLGHGPFSHLYDGKFLPAINGSHSFAHEHASIGIFDLLVEENELRPVFQAYGLGDDDIHFIKELMLGDKKEGPPGFVWKGRGHKTFLYDIVANKRNGIDVDKFDYFARDCHVLGLTKSFDAMRLMRFAMVFRVSRDTIRNSSESLPEVKSVDSNTSGTNDNSNNKDNIAQPLEICFHVKEAWNIFELFHTRYALHKRAYQHRVCTAVELMLLEILLLADPFLYFAGEHGDLRRMSECPNDMHAYWKLTDCVVKQIETSVIEELLPARAMVQRLRKRDLFAFAGEILLTPQRQAELKLTGHDATGQIKNEILSLVSNEKYDDAAATGSVISSSDMFIEIVKISYGKGSKNPVSGPTAFYAPKKQQQQQQLQHHEDVKENDEQDRYWNVGVVPQDSVSRVTPREFEETYIRAYSRYKHQCDTVTEMFMQWCNQHSVSSEDNSGNNIDGNTTTTTTASAIASTSLLHKRARSLSSSNQ